jgi:hypothetical protein
MLTTVLELPLLMPDATQACALSAHQESLPLMPRFGTSNDNELAENQVWSDLDELKDLTSPMDASSLLAFTTSSPVLVSGPDCSADKNCASDEFFGSDNGHCPAQINSDWALIQLVMDAARKSVISVLERLRDSCKLVVSAKDFGVLSQALDAYRNQCCNSFAPYYSCVEMLPSSVVDIFSAIAGDRCIDFLKKVDANGATGDATSLGIIYIEYEKGRLAECVGTLQQIEEKLLHLDCHSDVVASPVKSCVKHLLSSLTPSEVLRLCEVRSVQVSDENLKEHHVTGNCNGTLSSSSQLNTANDGAEAENLEGQRGFLDSDEVVDVDNEGAQQSESESNARPDVPVPNASHTGKPASALESSVLICEVPQAPQKQPRLIVEGSEPVSKQRRKGRHNSLEELHGRILSDIELMKPKIFELMQSREQVLQLPPDFGPPDTIGLSSADVGQQLLADRHTLEACLCGSEIATTVDGVHMLENVGVLLRWWRLAKRSLQLTGLFTALREDVESRTDFRKITLRELYEDQTADFASESLSFRQAQKYAALGTLLSQFPDLLYQTQLVTLSDWSERGSFGETCYQSTEESA